MADPDDQWAELLRLVDRGPDRMKQVEDRDVCERLLLELQRQLEPRYAAMMWDHYALGVPLSVLARREGVHVGFVVACLNEGRRRLRARALVVEGSDYLLTG